MPKEDTVILNQMFLRVEKRVRDSVQICDKLSKSIETYIKKHYGGNGNGNGNGNGKKLRLREKEYKI